MRITLQIPGGIMVVIAIAFLMLVCRCHGANEEVQNIATMEDKPLEDKWASLLREQEAKWASLLTKQEAKWTSILRNQQAETASSITELADVKSLLRLQEQKLFHQETLLQEQVARLSYQEALLQKQGRTIQQLNNKKCLPQTTPDENLLHRRNRPQPKTRRTGKTSGSTSHDVIPRADDAGSLEAVVSHISQQVTEMGADIEALKNSNEQQDLAIQDAQSSTFVHWGSSTCSNLSHTVYSGVVGGSWWTHSGAATNYLCLTMSPVSSDHPIPTYTARLYGGEYQTYESHNNKDAVCAVCRSTLSATVMIPGTNVCTPGWHLQYSGFLMAGYYNNIKSSEYVCVDSKLENSVHDNANENGALLFFTVTRCGSLPCSPYINNTIVTCAVCSM